MKANFQTLFCVVLLFLSVIASITCNSTIEKSDEGDLDIALDSDGELQSSTLNIPDEKWVAAALKNIAYFLRNHKFNEWDRRYYGKKPANNLIGFYKEFPMPPLRSLHWEVTENCDTDFNKCLLYLYSIIKSAPLTRENDILTMVNEGQISLNQTLTRQLHSEYNEALLFSEESGSPFDGPTEKFQWCTSASYYMCWYTMLEKPALLSLEEPCDNYANCLDPKFGLHNKDPRSDDRISFGCAMYSFCPDVCCPIKQLLGYNECYNTKINPCYAENSGGKPKDRVCLVNRMHNRNFQDIVKNKWNISCSCQNAGFIWKSEFGLCVDINECAAGDHKCDDMTEDCLNLPGKYMCICKWGFQYDKILKQCRRQELFGT